MNTPKKHSWLNVDNYVNLKTTTSSYQKTHRILCLPYRKKNSWVVDLQHQDGHTFTQECINLMPADLILSFPQFSDATFKLPPFHVGFLRTAIIERIKEFNEKDQEVLKEDWDPILKVAEKILNGAIDYHRVK